MARVVLPGTPFWLTKARMRAGEEPRSHGSRPAASRVKGWPSVAPVEWHGWLRGLDKLTRIRLSTPTLQPMPTDYSAPVLAPLSASASRTRAPRSVPPIE